MKKIITSILLGATLATGVIVASPTTNAYAYDSSVSRWSGYRYLTSACADDDIDVRWDNSAKMAYFSNSWGEIGIPLSTLQSSYGVKLSSGKLKITYSNYLDLYDDNFRCYLGK